MKREGREPFTAEKEVARAADAVIAQARVTAGAWAMYRPESIIQLQNALDDYDAAKAKLEDEG